MSDDFIQRMADRMPRAISDVILLAGDTSRQTASETIERYAAMPDELLTFIFLRLEYQTLKTLARLSRHFESILEQPVFDEILFRRPYREGDIAELQAKFDHVSTRLESWNNSRPTAPGPLFLLPHQFPIKIHPCLLSPCLGGFVGETLELPLQIDDDAPYFNEMATQPALQRLWICINNKKYDSLLEHPGGITVGILLRSLLARIWQPVCPLRYLGRYSLHDTNTRMLWEAKDHNEETMQDTPPTLCLRMKVDKTHPHY